MEINFIVSRMTELSLTNVFVFEHWGEELVTNQLCRIVVGISSQIGRDGHQDNGDVLSTYGKIIRNLLGSMKPPGSNLCRFHETSRFESLCRYLEVQVSQSISESENGKRPALSGKRSDVLNICR